MAHQIPDKLQQFLTEFQRKAKVGISRVEYNDKEPYVTDYFIYVLDQVFQVWHNVDDTWGWDVKWNMMGGFRQSHQYRSDDFEFDFG